MKYSCVEQLKWSTSLNIIRSLPQPVSADSDYWSRSQSLVSEAVSNSQVRSKISRCL